MRSPAKDSWVRRVLLAALALFAAAGPVAGQWSFDIPGVPRAGIVRQGAAQGRFELEGSWAKPGGESADTMLIAGRMGLGWSWRIASAFEFGFDFSLANVRHLRGLEPSASQPAGTVDASNSLRATAGYGLRFGLKFRPVSFVDLDGNGIEAAIGVGYQPQLDPLVHYEAIGDSSFTAGAVGSVDGPEVAKVHGATLFMAAVSYRSPRILGDFALVSESVSSEGNSFLPTYSGLSPRFGVRYRLTNGFGLGATFWGKGSPPWRDRPAMELIGESSSDVGLVFSFGATPEKSTDIMVSSPTGSLGESVTVYISVR
jgi:hypothetical protein